MAALLSIIQAIMCAIIMHNVAEIRRKRMEEIEAMYGRNSTLEIARREAEERENGK